MESFCYLTNYFLSYWLADCVSDLFQGHVLEQILVFCWVKLVLVAPLANFFQILQDLFDYNSEWFGIGQDSFDHIMYLLIHCSIWHESKEGRWNLTKAILVCIHHESLQSCHISLVWNILQALLPELLEFVRRSFSYHLIEDSP